MPETLSELSEVLHIVPHLGGGVGKALRSLVDTSLDTRYRHSFILLERPQKTQFLRRIMDWGCKVIICPDSSQADALVSAADIVQLEWWNHPATFKFLCERDLPPMRLLVWCHVSGLHTPVVPVGLIRAADRFNFTSPCSYEAPYISSLDDSVSF